ncbi:MAG TPA: DUF3060 domain-containing protein [Kofleriaceae bacterium]
MKRILFSILVFVPFVASADKKFTQGKGTTWDCKKDPVVSISHGGGKYTFKGACTTINVSGGGNKLTVESADELNLSGAKNVVTIGTVGSINLVGSKNTVTWKAAKTGDAPSINHVGKDNVVAQTGGGTKPTATASTAAAAPPATATAPATAGTVIDCAKTAVFSYVENDGTFTLQGKCDKIMISGNNNKVRVETVGNVMLSGNANTVEATKVDTVATSGNDNKVTYKGPLTGTKTKVMNTGNGNKISAVK